MLFLTLLTGPLGKLLAAGGLAAALLVAAALALRQHDARVLAEQTSAAEAAQIATMQADHARTVAALETQAADAAARASHTAQVRTAINADTKSDACAGSRPAAAWIDGMRQSAGGDAGASTPGAGQPAPVRAAAGAPR